MYYSNKKILMSTAILLNKIYEEATLLDFQGLEDGERNDY